MQARTQAFLIHLAITMAPVAAVAAIAYLAWYPAPYRQILGVDRLVLMLIVLALGLGPVLTHVVYQPGKKGLKFDLVVIALLQLAALGYATGQLYLKRPHYMVFAVDRFNLLFAGDFDPAEVQGGYDIGPLDHPLLVVATLPEDPKEREQLMMETLFEGKPDIDQRMQYWSLYSHDFPAVVDVALPLERLRDARPHDMAEIDRLAAGSGLPLEALVFHGVSGSGSDYAVVLERRSGTVIGSVRTNPWLE